MTNHDDIGPRSNRLKRLRRLVTRRRARSTERAFVVEGPVLVAEALRSAVEVVAVYAEPDAPGELLAAARAAGVEVVAVSHGALGSVLDTVTPRAVAAEVRAPSHSFASLAQSRPVLVLAELADPGNVGTLIRTAEAAGFAGVVIVGTDGVPGTVGADHDPGGDDARGAVDPTSPKVVRAAAGASLRLPVLTAAWDDAEAAIRSSGRSLVATVVDAGADPYDDADLSDVALVLGSEAHGLRPAFTARCDRVVTIPLDGPTESLNVAAAGAILCFASAQQRRRGGETRLPPDPSSLRLNP